MAWLDEDWDVDSQEGCRHLMAQLSSDDDDGEQHALSAGDAARLPAELRWIGDVLISTCDPNDADDADMLEEEARWLRRGRRCAHCVRLPSRRDGQGWGSGLHPATQLLCRWLQAPAVLERLHAGGRLCDYGCGSGILALTACALAGEITAVGVDIETTAVDAGRLNAAASGCEERCSFYLPSPGTLDEETRSLYRKLNVSSDRLLPEDSAPFDVIVANLWVGQQGRFAGLFKALLRPSGVLAVCGLHLSQAEDVMQAYSAEGIDLHIAMRDKSRGGWALLSNFPL